MAEEWFIAKNGAPIGPLTEEELYALHSRGDVEGDCLVWRQGMAGWVPFLDQFPGGSGGGAAAAPPQAPPPEPIPAPAPVPTPMRAAASPSFGSSSAGSLPAAMRSAKIMVNKPQSHSGGLSHSGAEPEEEVAGETDSWKDTSGGRITPALVKNVVGIVGKPRGYGAAAEAEEENDDLRPWVSPNKGAAAPAGDAGPALQPPSTATIGWNQAPSGSRMEGMPEDDQPIPPKAQEEAPVVHATSRDPRSSLFSLRHFPGIERLNPALLRPAMFSMNSLGYGGLKLAGEAPEGQAARAVCQECGKSYPEDHVNSVGGQRICKLCQQHVKERVKKEIERKENFRWLGGPLERAIYAGVFAGVAIAGVMLAMRLIGFQLITGGATSEEIGYKEILPPTKWVSKPANQWPQIALSNSAAFTDSSHLSRGASFLIKSQAGQVIGVSSMVLLRADHGVFPPVNPLLMNLNMGYWNMYVPNNKDKQARMQSLLTDPLAYVQTPVVYLEGKVSSFGMPAEPLKLQKLTLPDNSKVFIVIPDPSVTSGPAQRILRGNIRTTSSVNGQSVQIRLTEVVSASLPLVGAPVLNEAGHVTAVCIGLSEYYDIWAVGREKDSEVLPINYAQFQEGYVPVIPPDSDIVYAADTRGFPRSYNK